MSSADKSRGDAAYVEVYTGGGWVKPAGQDDVTLSLSKDTIEVTDKDSDGWDENIDGFKKFEVSLSMLFVASDSGQVAIKDAYDNNSRLNARVFDGTNYHTGYVRVTSYEVSAPLKDPMKISVTLTGDGAISQS